MTNSPLEVVSGTLCTPQPGAVPASGMLINHGHAEEQGSGTDQETECLTPGGASI